MGNQLVGIAASQILPVEHYLSENSELTFDGNLGSTRFFKVARAKSQEGLLVVKVFAIHDPSLPLQEHLKRIEKQKKILGSATNCLAFQRCILTEKAGFLLREFVKHSLYDRISTRPFLMPIEKKWIAYQILNGLSQFHRLGVCHGDIKLENICITSWNWVLITDFASFKPTYIPQDNPADFSYFFDTSRRRACYVAPERFVKTLGTDSSSQLLLTEDNLNKEELKPSMDIFSAGCSLAELFSEGQPPFDFPQLLNYRSGEYSLDDYLNKIEDEHIRNLVASMMSKDPSKRQSADEYLEQSRGKLFPEYFYNFLVSYNVMISSAIPILSDDEKLDRMQKEINNIIGVIIDEDAKWNSQSNKKDSSDKDVVCDALVLVISMITSCIRGSHFVDSKIKALKTLVQLAKHVSPEVLLDRILPYVMVLIKDRYPRVRIYAIQSLATILSHLYSVPQSDANVFPEYILLRLGQVSLDEVSIVREALAFHIGTISQITIRLLEYSQLKKNEVSRNFYEKELNMLHKMMLQMVAGLLTDSDNIVKQTLIENAITKLCIFFGEKSNEVLVPHMITYLNDKEDKQIRGAFFDCIVGVAAYMGAHCSPILFPLLQQGLTDPEEHVVCKAINAINALTEMSLLYKPALYHLLSEAAPFLVHPNHCIRLAVVGFISSVAKTLSVIDVNCKVAALIKPFLRSEVILLSEGDLLLNALKPCIPRNVYDAVIKYSELPLLLQIIEERRNAREGIPVANNLQSFSSSQTNSFRIWFNRLSSDGLNEDVEDLIYLIRSYLLKVNSCHSQDTKSSSDGTYDLTKYSCQLFLHPIKKTDPTKFEMYMPAQTKRSTDDNTSNMNEEWKTMFGREANTALKQDRSSSNSNDWNVRSSGSQSLMEHSIQERSYIQYRCSPSRLELRKLLTQRESIQRYRTPKSYGVGNSIPPGWRLRPGLVSHLQAHSGKITKLLAIPESTIMASCSSDSCIRIWDCGKMEGRNIANRARQVYNTQTGPLVGLTLCNANTCLGLASESGSIIVLKFESNSNKMSVFDSKQLDLEEEGQPVDLTYFDSMSKSVLMCTTIYGYILGWDLRAPGFAWKLQNDIRQGVVTATHLDNKQCFISLGTSSGFMTTWDLRFQLPISTFQHPTGSRIRKLCGHPKEPSWLISASSLNSEVSIWCIESGTRQSVFWCSPAPPLSHITDPECSRHSVCAMYSGIVEKDAFLLTGGTDHRIRYWDLDNYVNSYIAIPGSEDVMGQCSYSYKCRLIDGLTVTQEIRTKINPKSTPEMEGSPRAGPDPPPVGHHNTITDIAIVSGTGTSLLASGSYDGVIKVWK